MRHAPHLVLVHDAGPDFVVPTPRPSSSARARLSMAGIPPRAAAVVGVSAAMAAPLLWGAAFGFQAGVTAAALMFLAAFGGYLLLEAKDWFDGLRRPLP